MADDKLKVIQNAQIVLEQGILREGALVVADGRIVLWSKCCNQSLEKWSVF